MKPQLLKITHEPVSSFSVRHDMAPNINSKWHFHPEIELIYFHKGTGVQFIGDSIKNFAAGDAILIGSNLPHYWLYDQEYFEPQYSDSPFATVIHFQENFLGDRFFNLPEMRNIKDLLEIAGQGILYRGEKSKRICELIESTYQTDGLNRIMHLLECLTACAEMIQSLVLSSQGFRYEIKNQDNDRLNRVYNYTFKNFKNKVELKDVAEVAGFIPNSFCRYFKNRTGKTYYNFLTETRIGYACKLLIDNTQSVKQICFESGFQNFSSFHKSFRDHTGYTPHTYQKKYLKSS